MLGHIAVTANSSNVPFAQNVFGQKSLLASKQAPQDEPDPVVTNIMLLSNYLKHLHHW